MKFTTHVADNNRVRDARLVRELYQKSCLYRTDEHIKNFEWAEGEFMKKHNMIWSDIVKPEEKER